MSATFEQLVSPPVSVLEQYLQAGGDPDLVDVEGAPLLFYAVLAAELPHVEVLLRYGCNVNYKIKDSLPSSGVLASTALSLAQQCAFQMSQEKYGPIVNALVGAGARGET